MKQHLLTLFLALAVSVGTIFAETDSGTCGDNLTWTLDTESGTLTISGTGAMTDYTYSSNAPWYSSRASIKTVKIGSSVTSIGESAFGSCRSLTSVTIPNSVTSIGGSAFSYCRSLTSVTIPNSVTSIGNYAFCDSSLTSVHISDIAAWCKIAFGQGALSYAHNLYLNGSLVTDLVIPDGVISIKNYAFYGCSSLTSITIPNSVISIGDYAFSRCRSLTSVTIPNSVTSIGRNAFQNCTNLTSITIPNSVTSIDQSAFFECSSLTSVTIPNSVTSIGYEAFCGCSSLTSVTIPNSVTSIGSYAFYGCSSLTSITIPNSVTSIGSYAFSSCSSLTSVTIPNSVTSIGGSAFSYCTGLTSVTIGNSVTSIAQGAFYGCSSLKNVSIASSVKVLEGSAFQNCSKIETITCYGMRPPTVNTNALYGLSYSTIVYVPADYLETYKMHERWGLYDVRALENSGTEPETYTITWQDEDGNVIKTDQVAQGTTPAFTGTTPTKEGYTFAGWLPNIKPASKDMYYTTYFIPTQQQESKVYTVNINGENCSLNINNQYPEGTIITLEAVADECFKFQQWSDGNKDNPRTITVTANTNLTAEFNKVRYTVTGEPSTGGKVQIHKQ